MRCCVVAAVAGFLVVVTPGSLGAQNSVSISVGPAQALGSSAEALRPGFNASLALASKPPLASVGLRLEGTFTSFTADSQSTDGALRVLAATANATFSRADMPYHALYLIGGLGVYNTRFSVTSAAGGNNDVGVNAGLGINLTTGVGTFLEARYHHVPTEGMTLRFGAVSLGLCF